MRINKMLPQYEFKDFESFRRPAPRPAPVVAPPPIASPVVVEEEDEFATFAVGVA
jgi:hypothetical protein